MSIVLFGAGGGVGWELQRSLAPLGRLVSLDIHQPGPFDADVSHFDELERTIRALQPEVIVNAAAFTNVDAAESAVDRAFDVNARAPTIMANEAKRLGAWLVHFSSDYIFDGSGSEPIQEDQTPAPLNVYGRSKLAGEEGIRQSGCDYIIFRASWIHSARRPCFPSKILDAATKRDELSVPNDQVGSPTGADLIADVVAHAVARILNEKERGTRYAGVYNLACSGNTTRHAFAEFVLEWGRQHGLPIKTIPSNLRAVPTSTLNSPAQRPLNSRLSTAKLAQTFGLALPDWQPGLARMLAERYQPLEIR
jgi:dTDP-4-dehydrorhamnose reductase